MGILAEPFKEGGENFPQNKIILSDGRVLDCYPVAEEEPVQLETDDLALDTTGQYLVIGNQKPTPVPKPSMTFEEQRVLFLKNAFYLLAHKERILSDSRMFLCPVAIRSGLAYTGTSGFHKPTLGVYLEWWSQAIGAMQTDNKGRRSLLYQLAGSPLSGMNSCGMVYEDGKTEVVSLSSFKPIWVPFMKLNQRYTEAKQLYQAYTLTEVLDILHKEDNGKTDFSQELNILFMAHEIENLNRRIAKIMEECKMWKDKYENALIRYNESDMRKLYEDYEAFEAGISKEVKELKWQKSELKANLKRGAMDNVAYQKQLTPLKRHIQDLLSKLCKFRVDKVRETFPDEKDINFGMIERYMTTHGDNDRNTGAEV